MRTIASTHGFLKMPLNSNAYVLKECKRSNGVFYIQFYLIGFDHSVASCVHEKLGIYLDHLKN